jgi:hypothetical protein
MMKKLIGVICFCMTIYLLNGQTYYYKNPAIDEPGTIFQIIEFERKYFIGSQLLCSSNNRVCTNIAEINELGDIKSSNYYEDLDLAKSVVIHDSVIYTSGMNSLGNSELIIQKTDLAGNIIKKKVNKFTDNDSYMNLGFMEQLNEGMILTGQIIKNNKSSSIIIKFDSELNLIKTHIDTFSESNVIWDISIGPDSLLTCFIIQKNRFQPFDIRRIEKYDKDLNLVWKYIPDTLLSNMINIHGTVLNDGRIVYTYFTWGYPSRLPNVRCLDTVSKQNAWQYDYPKISQHARNIYGMKQLKNGDILLIGEYVSKVSAPHINGSPYLMRLDLNGTRKWERTYVEWDTDGEDKGGVLWDAIELDNGDLMAVGFVRNNGKWDPLLIRTDADGCIDQSTPSCPTVQIFDLMTGAVDVIGDKKTVIMPNPASDYIIIKNEELVFPVRYHMYTHTGQLISSGQTDMSGSVNINSLTSGLYLLNISDQNGITETIKWVKE